jgi:hypothetical protein
MRRQASPSLRGSAGGAGRGGAAGTAAGGRGAGGGTAGTGGLSGLLVPAQGALLGSFVGTGTIADLEGLLGRRLAISHNFYGWSDDYTGWIRTTLQSGYIPLVTWEAWINGGAGIPLDDIINGAHDAMIRSRAQSSLALGQKFFLRWGHEMNGNWYPWDGFHNGANAAAATKYIAAYRHIHDIFVNAGATNVLWVFSPTASAELGGDKAAWIAAILPALKTSFPAIKAFVWFHMNKETDWRINSSPQSQSAFVSMARDAYFNP